MTTFYLEGDEVLHESEVMSIRDTMEKNVYDHQVEALYFDFFHFYGTPNQVGIAGYRRAPRIVRNTIRSIAPDGLFWTIMDKNKRGAISEGQARGWEHLSLRTLQKLFFKMAEKLKQVGRYWGGVPRVQRLWFHRCF